MKSLFKSKTIWFNALTIIVVIATAFGYTPDQELADITSTILIALSPIINIVLRFVTNQGISLK